MSISVQSSARIIRCRIVSTKSRGSPVNFARGFVSGPQTSAEQAVSQDAHDENQRHHIRDRAAAFGPHEACKDKEENEWKEVVEENDRLVSKGELQIYFDES